jgi:carbamoyl-phosphate synthase large subunit
MPKRKDMNKILVIGSGPNNIGQGGEYDLAALQAYQALQQQGYSLVLVNSNPATASTFQQGAKNTYLEPLTLKSLTRIISTELPEAILPLCGGQAALNLVFKLHQSGILEKYSVQILGFPFESLQCTENPVLFQQSMQHLNYNTPGSIKIDSVEEAEDLAEEIEYPSLIRSSYTIGGAGTNLVYNREELGVLAERAFNSSILKQASIETSLCGWQELELELLRDSRNNCIPLCLLENIDPVGVHSGDSICVYPCQTIDSAIQDQLQEMALHIADYLQVTGNMHVKFAYERQTGTVMPLAVNLRSSRLSALCSKIHGLSVAGISALLACGATLEEIPPAYLQDLKSIKTDTKTTLVKFPKWDFGKFKDAEDKLSPQMRSVGEAIGLGTNFKEALQGAISCVRAQEGGTSLLEPAHLKQLTNEDLFIQAGWPTSQRFFVLFEALRRNMEPAALSEKSGIHSWFLNQVLEIIQTEKEISRFNTHSLDKETMLKAKKTGLSDKNLATILKDDESKIFDIRKKFKLQPGFKSLPAHQNPSTQSSFYFSYAGLETPPSPIQNSVLVLGGGANKIGEGTGLDTCCYQAGLALKNNSRASIFANCSPKAVSTAPDVFDRSYLGPLCPENIRDICEHERPLGLIVQFGGSLPLQVAQTLQKENLPILGTSLASMHCAESPELLHKLLLDLSIPQPRAGLASSAQEALPLAKNIGFPLLAKPGKRHSAEKIETILDQDMLDEFISLQEKISNEHPVWMEEFLEFAIEVEADVLADGQEAFVPAIMEHVELAGVHPGDCTWVSPPLSTPPRHMETIRTYARNIVRELQIKGLMNIRCAILGDTVYVLQVLPRASRTVPLISKLCNMDLIEIATKIILGNSLAELNLKTPYIPYYGVKKPVFPFEMLPEVDPVLGPEMQSTGEVLGISESFGLAFFKAQKATSRSLPLQGSIFLSVTDYDKPSILEPARLFREMGFKLIATEGTRDFLEQYGIEAELVRKLGAGRPTILDAIKNDQVHMLVNVPTGKKGQKDNARIRKAAVEHYIPFISTPADALVAARGISARKQNQIKATSLQEFHDLIR